MTDYHVHIGQYGKIYYYADRVFSTLKASGVDEVYFSSTTSCLYCEESVAARENPEILKNAPTALALYEGVMEEVQNALKAALEIGLKAHPLYWVVPEVHFSSSENVTIQKAMNEVNYDGFKIHPRAQKWDLFDIDTNSLADEIFSYAEKHKKLIMIHADEDFLPQLFENFIAKYPAVTVQIAHCRPLDDILYMLNRYPNVVADTAMANEDVIEKIKTAGFESRLREASDFPISNMFRRHVL